VLAAVCVLIVGGATAAVVAATTSPSSSRRTLAAPPEPGPSTTTASSDIAVNQVIAIENALSRDSGKAYATFQRAATHLSDLGRMVASANPRTAHACDGGAESSEACGEAFANAPDSERLRADVRADVAAIADGVGGISRAYNAAATRLATTKFRSTKAKADSKVARAKLAAVSSDAFAIAAEMPQSPSAMRMTLLFTRLGTAMSSADAALGDLNHDLGLPKRLTIS
jgi:hypothetical protein